MILQRKYPFKESTWGEQLLYAAIVFLILYLLRPFGLAAAQSNILLPCLASGLITFLLEMVHTLVARQVMKHKAKWTILDASIATILLVVFIGVGNFAFWGLYFGVSLFNLSLLLTFLYWTSIIGLFITFISIGISYNRMLRTELASMLNKTAEQQTDIRVSIRDAAVRGQALELPINDFLFAESVRNDIIVHYKQQDTVTSQTFRLTIAELMQQLPYDNVFQCHRSFVVNLNNITNAKGNSNGYILTLSPAQEAVPVSRSYVAKLKTFL